MSVTPMRAHQRRAGLCVAAAMQKGGVGKTTTVVSCARAAAQLGMRVLVIDLDPQGNTTDALAAEELEADDVSVADALVPGSEVALVDVLTPSIWDGVDLAPVVSEDRMTVAETHIAAMRGGREFRLKEALKPIRADYDLILIDNAPNLGTFLTNALAAADKVLVVMEADRWSLNGLAALQRTIDTVREYYQPDLTWGGVLINKWRGTRDEQSKLEEIQEYFADQPEVEIWHGANSVPMRVGIKQHINAGIALDESRETVFRVLAGVYREIVRQLAGAYETEAAEV